MKKNGEKGSCKEAVDSLRTALTGARLFCEDVVGDGGCGAR
jgi:hypothetical protein